MKGFKFFVTGVAILCIFVALPAYAGIQNWKITGEVTYFDQSCGTSLNQIGDTWNGLVSFDDSRVIDPLPPYYYTRDVSQDSLKSMISIPGWSDIYETEDEDYPNKPLLFLRSDNNLPFRLDFEVVYGGDWVLTLFGSESLEDDWDWKISEYNGQDKLIAGILKFTAVPIPGAVWLLGSGLVALVGLRKKTWKVQ